MLRTGRHYIECDTLFYQGASNSQTQALKYTGNQKIQATTGELMWSTGRNNLEPLNVIYNLHIGTEIADINLRPFDSYYAYLNPAKLYFSTLTRFRHYWEGVHIAPAAQPMHESVANHSQNLSQTSYGQASDIQSHYNKYQAWLSKNDKKNDLILWGVSRGTAATFCAFAKFRYPQTKLVVLEGAIDSVDNIVKTISTHTFRSEKWADYAVSAFRKTVSALNYCNLFAYRTNGEAPIDYVEVFPENVPVVFITSKKDSVVPMENTENIAMLLAARGKNDVYLLVLENSRHPFYMYDDENDRNTYEAFIHAIYRKYGLQHDAALAQAGEQFLEATRLVPPSFYVAPAI